MHDTAATAGGGAGRAVAVSAATGVTAGVADTTRQDLLVEAARALGRDPGFAGLDDREVADAVTTAVAELVVRGVWAEDGARSPATWLSWACGIGASTGREHVRVALRLRECPLVADRFASGRISYSKVRAITRVRTPELEPRTATPSSSTSPPTR